uniref:Serine-threonine/tyrosine-protein kinase catalytic domain-containing protein n=1 Tax=Oryza barthii TaxID=65489 RepID=A0A0D3EIY8_9ORYZ
MLRQACSRRRPPILETTISLSKLPKGQELHELERKLCVVALWCIQTKPHDRPAMSEVVGMLEDGADSLQKNA